MSYSTGVRSNDNKPLNSSAQGIAGAIFVGGKNSRMGGQTKALLNWQGQRFIDYQVDYLTAAGCDPIYLVGQAEAVACWPASVVFVQDSLPDYSGPLVALFSVLKKCQAPYLMTLPCDAVCLPDSLPQHFLDKIESHNAIYLKGQDAHYLIALHKTALSAQLNEKLASGLRSIKGWYADIQALPFIQHSAHENNWNINTPEDYEALQHTL